MDSRLRRLFKKFLEEQSPEAALDFASNFARAGQYEMPPVLEEPMTTQQLVDNGLEREAAGAQDVFDEINHSIDIDAEIRLPFYQLFPDDAYVNSFEHFLDLLSDHTYTGGSIQDMSYDITDVDEDDTLYFKITGWVEPDDDERFNKTYPFCVFCKSKELTYSDIDPNTSQVTCENCGWVWRQPAIIGELRRNPDDHIRKLERQWKALGGDDLRASLNLQRRRSGLSMVAPPLTIYDLRNPRVGDAAAFTTTIQTPIDGNILSSAIRRHHGWWGVHHALLSPAIRMPQELAEHRFEGNIPSPTVDDILYSHLHILYLLETRQPIQHAAIMSPHEDTAYFNFYQNLGNSFYLDAKRNTNYPIQQLLGCRFCGTLVTTSCDMCRMLVCEYHLQDTVCGREVCADEEECGGYCRTCGDYICVVDSNKIGDIWYCDTSPPCLPTNPTL